MKRAYYRKNEKVEVEEISGVAALQIAVNQRGDRNAKPEDFGTPVVTTRNQRITITATEAEAFEKSNWVFIHPNKETQAAINANEPIPNVTSNGIAIRNEDNRLIIANNELTIQFVNNLDRPFIDHFLKKYNLSISRELKFGKYLFEVEALGGRDALYYSVKFHEEPIVIFAEPAFIEPISQRWRPTDPDYSKQWQWNNDGLDGSNRRADLRCEEAWDITRGAGITLAVVDLSFDYRHQDIASALLPTCGYFNFQRDFIEGLNGMPRRFSGHGTFCAGMAAARHSNGHGGCGVAPESDLILVSPRADQITTQATLARAIAYAADHSIEVSDSSGGADVISCSLGPAGEPWRLMSVLGAALDFVCRVGRGGLGVPVFWSTDNESVPVLQDEVSSYRSVAAVGRSTRTDTAGGSAYGPNLDFLAPGVDVYSTLSDNKYGIDTGTSFAAPAAAGVAALALSVNPRLTSDQVRLLLRNTCNKIGNVEYDKFGRHPHYGYGRLNAYNAVLEAQKESRLCEFGS